MKRIVTGLFVALALAGVALPVFRASATLLDDIKKEIQAKEEEVRRLEAQKTQYEKTITAKRSAQQTLKNQIAVLAAEVEKLKVQLKITAAEIVKTTLGIQSLEERIGETEKRIAGEKKKMWSLFGTMRRNEDAASSLFALMLNRNPVSSALNQIVYMENLQRELLDHTMELKNAHEELRTSRAELSGKKSELETLKGRLGAEQEAKNDRQHGKESLLKTTKNEEVRYRAMLSGAEKRRQEILKDIKELEDKLRRTIDPASLPAPRPGVLEWPVRGIVSQEYGDTKNTGFVNDAYEFHNGIDIAGDAGTPIRAVRDGVVKAAGNNSPYAYGKWIAVEHANNLTTLYAHLSKQVAGQGSAVKKGQVIGYMGSTGFATGPHLHFTVYASNTFMTEQRWFGLLPLGGSVNPRNYLP